MTNDAFIRLVLITILAEVIWGAFLLFFRLSVAIPSVLFGLIIVQGLAIYAIDTAPAYAPEPSADLGGANLGPAIIAGIIFWGSALVLSYCLMFSVELLFRRIRKK